MQVGRADHALVPYEYYVEVSPSWGREELSEALHTARDVCGEMMEKLREECKHVPVMADEIGKYMLLSNRVMRAWATLSAPPKSGIKGLELTQEEIQQLRVWYANSLSLALSVLKRAREYAHKNMAADPSGEKVHIWATYYMRTLISSIVSLCQDWGELIAYEQRRHGGHDAVKEVLASVLFRTAEMGEDIGYSNGEAD